MISLKGKIYGLLVSVVISLCIAITLLILEIVFNYIGFINSDFTLYSCSDTYLNYKYSFLQHQLQVAFIGTCLAVAILIPFLALTGFSGKNLYQSNINNQQHQHQQNISPQIMSNNKFILLYLLASIGILSDIVSFGIYLAFWLESHKDPSTCLFIYNSTYLIVLIILSGVLLLGFLILHTFLFMIRQNFVQKQEREIKENKYKETINITQQQGLIKNHNAYQSYNNQQYADQHFEGDTSSFGQKQFYSKENDDIKNIRSIQNQSILNSQNSFNGNNLQKEKQTFQQYRARQMNEFKNTESQKNHQNHYNKDPHSLLTEDNNNYNQSKFTNGQPSDQRMISFGKQNNNNLKPYSPIRMLAQNINQNSNEDNQYGNYPPNKSVNNQNPNSYRQQSDRGSEQNTRGQLVFYKRAMQKSRRQEGNGNLHSRVNENKDAYNKNINKNNQSRFPSGEVSFKSPSKFDSKFTEQQNDYLRKNAQNSILPNSNIREVTGGSRKIVFDDKYSSSGVPPSNFGQSRNLDSSPSQSRSRTKAREGVLTSFIRGKFS